MFCLDRHTPVCIRGTVTPAVELAVRDLERDLDRLLGMREKVLSAAPIEILTTGEGVPESFSVTVDKNRIRIAGSDILGTVYGIYDFEYRLLGIDPMTRVSGLFPAPFDQKDLPDTSYTDAPGETRFRGWFLNDEDLLTDFKAGGGNRDIDYPFYDHVMHPDVLEMVIESALRCKINLLIPSSFVDIMNPAEEQLVRAVTRRGLYISQHHVEPLGVSWFSAAKYMKGQGLEENVSFLGNRTKMEEIWREYAKRWAKYRTHVIWQLGLRGKADRAVWKSDSTIPMNEAARGAIITDAIQTQYDIVREVLGNEDFYSTVTLWLEGAELYGKGYLRTPEGSTAIFSDIGINQMFGQDFFTTERLPGRTYGVYYHVGYWTEGPHLAEACTPQKMEAAYRAAKELDSLYYSILNVANLRELHRGAHMNAALVWAPARFQLEEYLSQRYAFVFGKAGGEIQVQAQRYFDAFADLGEEALRAFCQRHGFYYRHYGQLHFKNCVANDGVLRTVARYLARGSDRPEIGYIDRFVESERRFSALCEEWKVLKDRLPSSSREYFEIFYLLQAEYMLRMTRWLIGFLQGWKGGTPDEKKKIAAPLHEILELRRVAERGPWQGWYNGERKIGVSLLIQLTEKDIY